MLQDAFILGLLIYCHFFRHRKFISIDASKDLLMQTVSVFLLLVRLQFNMATGLIQEIIIILSLQIQYHCFRSVNYIEFIYQLLFY